MIMIALYFSLIYPFGLANYIDLSLVGEVLFSGFDLAVPSARDIRGSEARIVLLLLRIKRWGLFILFEFTLSTSCHFVKVLLCLL